MKATQETWLPVVGHEGFYEVSDLGRARSLDRVVTRSDGVKRRCRGQVLIPRPGAYPTVLLRKPGIGRTFTLHALVTTAFLGECPAGMQVCHENGDRLDNRLSNLRYDTPSNNNLDQVRHGTHPFARRTECDRGHEFTPENTLFRSDSPGGRARRCRACKRDRVRKRTAA